MTSPSRELLHEIRFRTHAGPSYWLQGSIDRVECDAGEQAKTTQPISPSPLTAEDQSLSQCLTLGAEGENHETRRCRTAIHHTHATKQLTQT